MAAKLILAFASALLVQTISGQITNAGVIDVTNVGVAGNGVGLSNNGYGLSGIGSGLSGNTNAGVIDFTNIGVTGNGIGLSNNGGGYGLNAVNGNVGIAGNGIGLANGVGNLGLASSGIGVSYGSLNNLGYAAAPLLSYGSACGNGYGANTNGGAFSVSSASPLGATGLTVVSENAIEGAVDINGALPFLSAVALEGQLASGGAAGLQYGCGNGNVGIVSENVATANAGYGAGLGYGAGVAAGYGLGAGLGGAIVTGPEFVGNYGSSCGCNGAY